MKKEIFVTKLPTETTMADFIADLLGDFGITTRTKEEVDADLTDFLGEDADLSGTYYQITIEEIE